MCINVTAMTRIVPNYGKRTKAMHRLQYSSDSYNTRNKQNLHLERVEKNWDKQKFGYHAVNDWNSLPVELRETEQFASSKIEPNRNI
jgi:hypothetical protein